MARWMVAVMLVAGCDRTYIPCAGGNELVDGVVDTSGGIPVFDWEYGTAYALSVYDLERAKTVWHVQCGGDRLSNDDRLEEQVCIETPIAYGEEVHSEYLDTVSTTRARPLTPGASYLVSLHTMIEDDGPSPERDGPEWLDFLDWQSDRDDPHCGSAFSAEVEFVAP
jgi:hypothetical protein